MEHVQNISSPVIKKVAIGICLKGHTPPESYHDRMMTSFYLGQTEMEQRIKNESPRYEFLWFTAGELFTPFARDVLAKAALSHDCDYLFMIDDDQLAPPEMFYQLVRHDVDIIGALAFTRNPPHNPVIYEVIEGYDKTCHAPYYITNTVKSYPRNTIVECDAIGFGAVLIKSKVLKAMPQQMFMSTSPTGEDILFCNKAKKLGFRVFMDTSVKMGHLGRPTIITEEYSDEYNQTSESERERQFGKYQKYANFERTK